MFNAFWANVIGVKGRYSLTTSMNDINYTKGRNKAVHEERAIKL